MTDLGKAPDARQEFTCWVSGFLFVEARHIGNVYCGGGFAMVKL